MYPTKVITTLFIFSCLLFTACSVDEPTTIPQNEPMNAQLEITDEKGINSALINVKSTDQSFLNNLDENSFQLNSSSSSIESNQVNSEEQGNSSELKTTLTTP